MALTLITFTDKEDYRTTDLDPKYRVVAADMNEIKTKVNAVITALNTNFRQRIVVNITASDFTGGYYDNANAVGLTAGTDIIVMSNEGSGTLLRPGNEYTFDDELGRFTMDRGAYSITIYKPLSA